MPTSSVTYVYDQNGQSVEREKKIPSVGFLVKMDTTGNGEPDLTLGQPAVTQNVEIENSGDSATPTDQCGNTERFRATNDGWMIRAQGIVTKSAREGNLTLGDLRDTIASAESIWVRTDIINGQFAVQNTVITQSSDLVSIEMPQSDGKEEAFEFQLQIGESQSDS